MPLPFSMTCSVLFFILLFTNAKHKLSVLCGRLKNHFRMFTNKTERYEETIRSNLKSL